MNKKSQFYMFAGVILIGLVFAIVSDRSGVRSNKLKNTQTYIDNYKYEATVVINNAIYHNKNISEELRNFTGEFISYAGEKGVDLGILYMYSDDGSIFVGNHLKDPITIRDTGDVLNPDDEVKTAYESNLSIRFGNETYWFYFVSADQTELRTLAVQNE